VGYNILELYVIDGLSNSLYAFRQGLACKLIVLKFNSPHVRSQYVILTSE
jgi:hypothetical protein